MIRSRLFGVAQEAGIDTCIAERQRLAIDPHWAVLQRANKVFRLIHQRIEVAAMFPTLHVGGGDEDFERRIARARSPAGARGIDAYRTSLDRDNAIPNLEAQLKRKRHRLTSRH